MDFVEGEPLGGLIREKRLNMRDSAALMEKVARALGHAHASGVVHRDLKPDNVIVDSEGEPHLVDFGLAKISGKGASHLTQDGAAMGTPHYESPEQAAGRSSSVDNRSDIYSLGCIFYEMLVGRPPFVAEAALDVLRMHVEEEPFPPSKLKGAVSADAEAICLKCLEKRPIDRYHTAEELADDLRRFLDGEAVEARHAHRMRSLARHLRIHTVLTSSVLFVLILAIWSAYLLKVVRENAEDEIRRNGAQAALLLAEHGRDLTREYRRWKRKNMHKKWETRSLSRTLHFRDAKGKSVHTGVEDAVVLCGDVLVASADPKKLPRALMGHEESIDERLFKNVECLRGSYLRRVAGGKTHAVPVLQFKAPFEIEGHPLEGTARLVISIESVDRRVNKVIVSLVVASIPLILASVLLMAIASHMAVKRFQSDTRRGRKKPISVRVKEGRRK
jgi:hypothetical protein